MNIPIKNLPLALASAVVLGALGFVGCGTSGPGSVAGPAGPPDTVVTPTTPDPLPEPKVQYNFFRPTTEAELTGRYSEGQLMGRPIVNYGYLIARTTQSFSPASFAKHGLEVLSSFTANGGRYFYLHRAPDEDGNAHLVETMDTVRKMHGVMYIEPEMLSYTTAVETSPITYNNPDTYVASNQLFGMLTTHTKKAWETYGFGPHKPVVADFDTGVRWAHNDLQLNGKSIVRHAFSWYGAASNGALLTNLGTLDPINDPEPPDRMVTNFNDGTSDRASSAYYHGSHTAGTIAAVGNNGIGVAGVCWNVDLVSYKVLSDGGSGGNWAIYGSFWNLAKWKNTLVDAEGAPSPTGAPRYPYVIPVNLSLGGPFLTQFNTDMVEVALEHGILPICASGNDNSGVASWPAGISGAMSVGAVNFMDRRIYFSSWGNHMSVVAPGNDVYSLSGSSNTAYQAMGGTSMAAPHVTGLAAYLLSYKPDLKIDQLRTYIEKYADPIDGQNGFSPYTGWGRINTYRSVGALISDINGAGVPASSMVYSPVKVVVKTATGARVDGSFVYLYNCNASGTISNFASVAISGPTYTALRDDKDAEIETGVAHFNGLRPGYYKVTAVLTGLDATTGADAYYAAEAGFTVAVGATVPTIDLTIPADMLFIQTMLTRNGGSTDTVIRLYDADGELLKSYDLGDCDTLACLMPPPGTYYVNIRPYGSSYYGQYALWLGTSMKPEPAPGNYADPGADGIQSAHATTMATAQEITINGDKLIYGNLSSSTGGTNGHWYKFTVE